MEPRITAVTLGVSDVAKSVAFYARLGLKAHTVMDHVAFLDMNGAVLCLYSGLAEDAGVVSQRREIGLFAVAHNVREPGEVDALLEDAKAAITEAAADAPELALFVDFFARAKRGIIR